MSDLDFGATIRGYVPGQRVFNRYSLCRILGRGGMGVVWLAHDEELDQDVALKFLPEMVAVDPEAINDLKRETRRTRDLVHPRIVQIYDLVRDAQTVAISMEYVDGSTLAARKVAAPSGHLEVAQVEPLLRQLLEGLDHAHHKAGVAHRDLKPANLIARDNGELKIADFGIARSITDSASRVSRVATGDGSLPYMSPQQLLGEKPAVTDDLYSVGATLFELLAGKPPFFSGGAAAIMHQIQHKTPPSVAEARRELEADGEPIPESWERAIAACLAKQPAQRPQTVSDLRRMLWEPDATPHPAVTPAPARPPRLARPATFSPARAAALRRTVKIAAFVVLGLLASGGAYVGGSHLWEKYKVEMARREVEDRLRREREAAAAQARAAEEQRLHDATMDRIRAVVEATPRSAFDETADAIARYLADAPPRFRAAVENSWEERKQAWLRHEAAEAARVQREREEQEHARIVGLISGLGVRTSGKRVAEVETEVSRYLSQAPERHRAELNEQLDQKKRAWSAYRTNHDVRPAEERSRLLRSSADVAAFLRNLSGKPGAPGMAGRDGLVGSEGLRAKDGGPVTGRTGGNGGDGTDGTHGGNGGIGEDAGQFTITIREVMFEEENSIAGITVHRLPAGPTSEVYWDMTDSLTVNVSGGRGGDGGKGGNGGAGGKGGWGGDGDARYHDGGRGGNAGSGGNGGNGGNGGRGGNGGLVTLRVQGDDVFRTAVLQKIVVNTKGGAGGSAGSRGTRGAAGLGAIGGSGETFYNAFGQIFGGRDGRDGYDGDPGRPGNSGVAGVDGKDGAVTLSR